MPPKIPAAQDTDHVASGVAAIRTEIEGLEALALSLGNAFRDAVDLIAGLKGRVITTGMGKSGHIARKIAATLASTGTPAGYVHPAEASHGDLGMITENDAVLALSNSGETAEMADIIGYTRRFSIPLIGITSGKGSTLDKEADISLILPAAAEACPNGLAPTTTTTMALVLGDALAVALLKQAGFTANDYKRFHHGGKLGNRLTHVRDLMHTGNELPLTLPDTSMSDAILTMTEKRFGCVGIIDIKGKLIGIITDGDLRRKMDGQLLRRSAEDVMTRGPRTVPPDMLASEALGIMNSRKITTLFVVENEKPVGILHMHDILRAGVV